MPKNNSQFQIIGTKIYDSDGQEFIVKGVNMFAWEGLSQVDSLINHWGFNTIRVPNYLLGSYDLPHPEENNYGTNHQIVDVFTSQGSVVIFDAHDRIGGYYEASEWEILKDYWRNMAQEFKDNPNVWFNLHNEPGNAIANPEKWVSYHRELIDIIRAEGADNLIVVDGEAWGQDFYTETIATHAQEVLEQNENIVFSIHAYEQWNNNDIASYLDELYVRDIPVIIGEYGSENEGQSTLDATNQTITATQEREIGRIAWSANLTSGNIQDFDGTNPEVLTNLGGIIWEDLQRTEDLESLDIVNNQSNQKHKYTSGFFKVKKTGVVDYEFLFDGGWFQGELAVFNLEGMEAYEPGSIAFIQEAARRAQTNSNLGYVLIEDSTEKALFDTSLPWENNFNQGNYGGVGSFTMNRGDKFALILTQNNTTADIVNNPHQIWEWGKLPIFSIPEANPGGNITRKEAKHTGQIVAVDKKNGVYAMEDVRIDWQQSDYDYNDIVFKLTGVKGIAPKIDVAQNPERRWQDTATGQKILQYVDDTLYEGVFAVHKSGIVDVDFLYDSGSYEGELGVFSLSGLANLDVNSVAFKTEAIQRALSNSKEGYIVLEDDIDRAKFTDVVESQWQQDLLTGEYRGVHSLAMNPGDLVGFVFNPKGTLKELLNSSWNDDLRPMFSLTAANFDRIQMIEITSKKNKTILGWEDIDLNLGADADYNDLVIGLEGLDSIGVPEFQNYVQGDLNWLETSVGQKILDYF